MTQKKYKIFFALSALISTYLYAFDVKSNYDTSYYEKYNPDIKHLSSTAYVQSTNFFILSGRMSADGLFYTLGNAQQIQQSQQTLQEYGLETVVIEVDGTYYKAKASLTKLFFTANGKKGGFGYSTGKELILVYVPYSDKIQVIGSISNGQFIKENDYRTYDIDAKKQAKRKVLYKTFDMLGCKKHNSCDVKSDKKGNNYFYKNGTLLGMIENFGSEKILLQEKGDNKKHIATIKMYGDKILMKDTKGSIILRLDGSKKIRIKLEALDYELGLKISN